MLPLRVAALTLLAAPLGQAEETPAHLGPVTGIVVVGGLVYSASQAGFFREAKHLAKPPFRVMSMAASKPLLLVGGGQPAASGDVAVYDSDGGSLAKRHLGDDLVYSVAVAPDGKTAAAAMADGRVLTFAFPGLAATLAFRRLLVTQVSELAELGIDASCAVPHTTSTALATPAPRLNRPTARAKLVRVRRSRSRKRG